MEKEPDETQRNLPIIRTQSEVSQESVIGYENKLIRPDLSPTRRVAIGRKGQKTIKTKGGNTMRLPEKLDYFLVQFPEKDEKQDFLVDQVFHSREDIGAKPRTLPIELKYDSVGHNAFVYLAFYDSRRARCKSTGPGVATRITKDGASQQVDCTCEYLKKGNCKPHIRFQFRLRGVSPDEPEMGTGEMAIFRSTGKRTISSILGGLRDLKETIGHLFSIPWKLAPIADIPLTLTFRKDAAVDQEGKTRIVPVVSVTYKGSGKQLGDLVKKRQEYLAANMLFQEALLTNPAEAAEIARQSLVGGLKKRRVEENKEAPELLDRLAGEEAKAEDDIADEFHPESEDITKLSPKQKEERRKEDLKEGERLKNLAKDVIPEAVQAALNTPDPEEMEAEVDPDAAAKNEIQEQAGKGDDDAWL